MGTVDLWFELRSPDLLVTFMETREMTVRELAAKCVVKDPRAKGKTKPLSRAYIGHLRTGHKRTCSPAAAAAIEKALKVPPNVIFTPRVQERNRAA